MSVWGAVSLAGAVLMTADVAVAAEPFGVDGGTVSLNARFRLEHVDQEGINRTADASTLRLALGYRTPKKQDIQGFIEGEVVESIGSARYNSRTNNRTSFPVVVDPDTVELNQAYLRYDGLPATGVVVGRQVINMANQRHIGAVGFRQNHQTFDALRVTNRYFEKVTIDAFFFVRSAPDFRSSLAPRVVQYRSIRLEYRVQTRRRCGAVRLRSFVRY